MWERIETERLVLRRPEPSDRALWVRLHRDPVLYAHAPQAISPSDAAAGELLDTVLAHWDARGFGYQVIEERGVAVGLGGLRTGDGDALNLYYRLDSSAHGRGLATEAARAWTAHALEWLPGRRVEAVARPHNDASLRTAGRAGLTRVGELDDVPGEEPSVVLRAPRVVVHREPLEADDREGVLDLWCATNDAGGAVGFLPGASRQSVGDALAGHEQAMADGRATGVTLRAAVRGGTTPGATTSEGEPGSTDDIVALGFWEAPGSALMAHRRTAYRVMTHPAHRGHNLGRLLMAAMHAQARGDRVEIATLGVRGGTGTERFYERCGYAECGRVPGGIRVSQGEVRDDILMMRRL